ncbi:MAG: helix-hairpin-helix domain-containing protein [Gemmatimonadota bacterium]|nr:helix-hairpin-helix domain-containing protein [Gemmatimonadota bacterium]
MTRTCRNLTLVLPAILFAVACGDGARDGDQTTDTAAGATVDTGAPSTSQAFLDPNSVSQEQLLTLPGMDSAAAQALVNGRTYDNMLAVDRTLATHLSETERDSLYTRLWKPIDLNSASAEEIMLIPGVGDRMRREFEEYRPYTSMEQFRREIGKYVNDAEVARLERYVTIR